MDVNEPLDGNEMNALSKPNVDKDANNKIRRCEKPRWSISKQDLRDMLRKAKETGSISK